jgi:hypothetical protein
MAFAKGNKIIGYFRRRKLARLVRKGIVPQGVSKEEIFEALAATRPRGVVEFFGFLTCKVFDSAGNLKQDCGLQSVKEVTAEFAKHLIDNMCGAASGIVQYKFHAMGDGSTAETDTQTALVNQQGTRATGSQTHGASSNIYQTVATITAGSAFTAIEHGIFDSSTATDDKLLDRSLVASPPTLITGDEVEWTYALTVNAGG